MSRKRDQFITLNNALMQLFVYDVHDVAQSRRGRQRRLGVAPAGADGVSVVPEARAAHLLLTGAAIISSDRIPSLQV